MFDRVVLVTGGAGFLGSHLCDRLMGEGARVICLDNLMTGSISNISHLIGRPGFRFVQHDVITPFDPGERIDEIFNLACPASPPKYALDPIHTFQTCVLGAMNMLDLARRQGARIVQSSTSEVYGDPTVSPQPETYRGYVNPVGPRACYDEGKRGAETLFFHYRESYGVDARIARIFNTYGPRMSPDDGRVVSNFIVQALTGAPLTVYGTGEQTRSFCYVDDLVEGLLRLMAAPGHGLGPVNLGNPGEFTMLELAELVLAKTRAGSRLTFEALPQDDPRQRRPDIMLAGQMLGWAPTVPLSEGLDRTIAYFAESIHQGKTGE
ncbi:UDP-glucuronic acid decarboxylase family protein [Rhodovulum strictum]|uniref:NAD-dependent epimerase/dehydratase family protein n=1 Tax=Rhodovulum strictum TaxID=58314 RepID=A0A844BC74_9RHOB|nr:UDP-glucuronic acid decarboxylase family protein [Rhodovulum strictum]MRH22054.1 NAD-dependent epimerase/dehydratase family protein [Rhodovulum strictum]